MTDTVDQQLDKELSMLDSLLDAATYCSSAKQADAETVIAIEQAKQAIKEIIATEVLRARVDELERYYKVPSSVGGIERNNYAESRIAELEAQLNKGYVGNMSQSP